MTKIGIIHVGIGNIRSVYNAFFVQGWDAEVVSRPEDLALCSHLVLPGVGNFKRAIQIIEDEGYKGPLSNFAKSGKPILGICLGMQLFAESSKEGGLSDGLSFISGSVEKFSSNSGLPVPHVGWNAVTQRKSHPVFSGVSNEKDFYFVHSFHYIPRENETILTETNYGQKFVSAIAKANVVGVQFHPEKSQKNGLKIIDNFALWDGQW